VRHRWPPGTTFDHRIDKHSLHRVAPNHSRHRDGGPFNLARTNRSCSTSDKQLAAVFLYVAPAEVEPVAQRFEATPFDIENMFWSHRGELCTFDVMVKEFGLSTPPLERLATMVRAADTARLDLSPEAPGLLAASLGLSRMYDDDLEQLSAGMLLYDAFYRWCRDASKETHNWSTNKVKS